MEKRNLYPLIWFKMFFNFTARQKKHYYKLFSLRVNNTALISIANIAIFCDRDCTCTYTACLHVIAFNKNNFATNCFHFRYAFIAFITLISSFSINFHTQYLEKYISYFNKIYTVELVFSRSF